MSSNFDEPRPQDQVSGEQETAEAKALKESAAKTQLAAEEFTAASKQSQRNTASFQRVMEQMGQGNKAFLLQQQEIQNDRRQQFEVQNKSQSVASEKFTDHLESLQESITDIGNRREAGVADKKVSAAREALEENDTLTPEERKYHERTLENLDAQTKNQLQGQFSLFKEMSGALVDNLPSLTGLLGAVGLDNPAMMFVGQAIQDTYEKRKDDNAVANASVAEFETDLRSTIIQNEQDSVSALNEAQSASIAAMEAYKEAMLKSGEQTEEEIEQSATRLGDDIKDSLANAISDDGEPLTPEELDQIIQISSDKLLSYLDKNMIKANEAARDSEIQRLQDILVGNKLGEIENQRETSRYNEEMLNALQSGNDVKGFEDVTEKKGKGLLGSVMGILGVDSPLELMGLKAAMGGAFSSLAAGGTKLLGGIGKLGGGLKGLGSGLLKGAGKFAGPAALIFTAIDFAVGAFKGWGNTAEKLGKNAEDVTVFDKMSSAIGGGFGSVVGIIDSITGLFGFETDIGGMVDRGITNILAGMGDFFGGMFDVVFPEGFSITEMLFANVRLLAAGFDKLFSWALPEGWSLSGLVNGVIDRVKGFFSNIFTLSFPEGFDLTGMIALPFNAIKEFWGGIFSMVLPEGFSISGMLQGVYDKIAGWFQDKLSFSLPALDFKDIQQSIIKALFGVLKFIPGASSVLKRFGIDLDAKSPSEIKVQKEKETKVAKGKVAEARTEKKGIVEGLEDTGIIDIGWGKGKIKDWDAMEQLKPAEIQKVIDSDEWSKEDLARMQALIPPPIEPVDRKAIPVAKDIEQVKAPSILGNNNKPETKEDKYIGDLTKMEDFKKEHGERPEYTPQNSETYFDEFNFEDAMRFTGETKKVEDERTKLTRKLDKSRKASKRASNLQEDGESYTRMGQEMTKEEVATFEATKRNDFDFETAKRVSEGYDRMTIATNRDKFATKEVQDYESPRKTMVEGRTAAIATNDIEKEQKKDSPSIVSAPTTNNSSNSSTTNSSVSHNISPRQGDNMLNASAMMWAQ